MTKVARRPYEVTDEAFIRDLFCDLRRPEFLPLGLPDEQLDALLQNQFALRQSHYSKIPDVVWEIFVEEGEPIGFVGIAPGPAELRVVDIALSESRRGIGIGSAFFDELISRAEAEGRAISLFVEFENPARRLYTRLGFKERDEQGVYVEMVRPCRGNPAPSE
jgi:ribosomal protein S18 acetylase RimI-like enzyme